MRLPDRVSVAQTLLSVRVQSAAAEIANSGDDYRPTARLRVVAKTDTVATLLSTLPHGPPMRSQNCDVAAIDGTNTDAALPPIGCVKSRYGPWYHWNDSDAPRTTVETITFDPAGTLWFCGCDAIVGGAHDCTTVRRAVLLSAAPQSLDTCNQYDADANSGGTASVAEVPAVAGCDVSGNVPSYH